MKPRDLASLYARSLFLGSASLLHVLAVVLGVGVYAAAATLLGLTRIVHETGAAPMVGAA